MDNAILSVVAALSGSVVGGLTSVATTWFSQRAQFLAQQREGELARHRDLYRSFIEEASRLYTHAYEHDKAAVSDLVHLYALISMMHIVSSSQVIESADRVARAIIKTYQLPNKSIRDVEEVLDNSDMNPLRDFSNACRAELYTS